MCDSLINPIVPNFSGPPEQGASIVQFQSQESKQFVEAEAVLQYSDERGKVSIPAQTQSIKYFCPVCHCCNLDYRKRKSSSGIAFLEPEIVLI